MKTPNWDGIVPSLSTSREDVTSHLSTGTFVDASPCVQFCSTCS